MGLEDIFSRKKIKRTIRNLIGGAGIIASSFLGCNTNTPNPAGGGGGTNPGTQPPVQPPTQPPSTPTLTVDAGPDLTIDEGICVSLHGNYGGGINPYEVLWTASGFDFPDNEKDVIACPTQTTTHTFTVRDGVGVQRQDSMIVNVRPKPGTGVPGLNSPAEILRNSEVLKAFGEFASRGFIVAYDKEGDKPAAIEGRYKLGGKQVYPFFQRLPGGTIQWLNQTPDGKITTEISESLLGIPGATSVSRSREGEIIKGEKYKTFSVFGLQKVVVNFDGGSCALENLLIMCGERESQGGQISGAYTQIPIKLISGDCALFPAAGVFKAVPIGNNDLGLNYTTISFKDVLSEHGYDINYYWPSEIKWDEFRNWGIFLNGSVPLLYDYLRYENLGGNTSFIPPQRGSVIVKPFSQIQGSLENPWIFNFDPPVNYAELKFWDGNGNRSDHGLLACSNVHAGGRILDADVISDPESGFNTEIMNLRVRSQVPIWSVWLNSYPYMRTEAESITIGRR